MEVFNTHLVSRIDMNDMTRKIVDACAKDTVMPWCKFVGSVKKIVNGTATYVEKEAKSTSIKILDDLGIKEPVYIVGAVAKIVIDKKIRIAKLRHLPLLNNDNGALEVSLNDVKWTMSWNF